MNYGSLSVVIDESDDDYIAEVLVEEAVCSMIETGSPYLMECLANGEYGIILEETFEELKKETDKHYEWVNQQKASKFLKDPTLDDDITVGDVGDADKHHEYMTNKAKKAHEADTEKGLWAMAKRAVSKGRDFIAKLIGKLNTWMRRIVQKEAAAGKGDPDKLGFFGQIKRQIVVIVEWLTRKLHNLVQSKRGDISSTMYYHNKNKYDEIASDLSKSPKITRFSIPLSWNLKQPIEKYNWY